MVALWEHGVEESPCHTPLCSQELSKEIRASWHFGISSANEKFYPTVF